MKTLVIREEIQLTQLDRAVKELSDEEKILKWRDSDSPVLRTSKIIDEFNQTGTFVDTEIFEKVKIWIQHLVTLRDSFCSDTASQKWEDLCVILLIIICSSEQNQKINEIIKEGSEQGYFSFEEVNSIVDNFSSLLWLLGLAESPAPFFIENQDAKHFRVQLINNDIYHGQAVLNEVHKKQPQIPLVVYADTANLATMETSSNGTINQGINK
jgi:hypothetical protein